MSTEGTPLTFSGLGPGLGPGFGPGFGEETLVGRGVAWEAAAPVVVGVADCAPVDTGETQALRRIAAIAMARPRGAGRFTLEASVAFPPGSRRPGPEPIYHE
jgi:hypothetical protein